MRYFYSAIIPHAPDTGEEILIFRPEIKLTIHGPKGARKYSALVDTGAAIFDGEQCVLDLHTNDSYH